MKTAEAGRWRAKGDGIQDPPGQPAWPEDGEARRVAGLGD